jgi:uncharacterized membrane protein (UPF0136 family)
VSLRRLANVLLVVTVGLFGVAAAADAIDAIGDRGRAAAALAGLALLVGAQGIRSYLDRSPRPLLVLALVTGLLAFLLFSET